MPSDPELSALQTKLTEATAGSAFTPRERELLVDGLRRIEADPDARSTPFRRELDFFLVRLGYCLLAFAVIVTMRWAASDPLGGAGAFGLAFITGLSAAALQRYYPRARAGTSGWTRVVVAGAGLVISLFALTAAGAIGAVLGIAVGAVTFQALRRQRNAPTAHDASASGHAGGQPA